MARNRAVSRERHGTRASNPACPAPLDANCMFKNSTKELLAPRSLGFMLSG
jgi:hypothetical protein